MPSIRQRKITRNVLISLAVSAAIIFYFRYDLMLRFQLWRLGSLHCNSVQVKSKNPCLERIWAHRVNSTVRYQLLKSKFPGMETDIVFNKVTGAFSVYHPPLVESDSSLSLDEFLGQVDLQQSSIWLDTRGVDSLNAPMALAALSSRPWSEALKEKAIIELYNVSAAQYFAANGYRVSLNLLGVPKAKRNRESILAEGIEMRLRQVQYVSQGFEIIPALKRLFPGKKIITWDPRIGSFFKMKRLQVLLDDPDIDIILVNIKSRYRK